MKSVKELFKKEKLAVIFLVGLLLLILALPVKSGSEDTETGEEEAGNTVQDAGVQTAGESWETEMENRLKAMLEQTEGVGRAEVFLTCKGTKKAEVEKDETSTVYEKDAKGNQVPYVSVTYYPEVTGVLVVAQGGDNPVVIQNIQEAVQALFEVEVHKIKVMKMN